MKTLALVAPNKESFSETFIKAQVDLLPFNTHFYYGGYIPRFLNDKSISTSESLVYRFYYKILRFFGITKYKNDELDLIRSFRKNRIEIVLAQYGPTGEALCRVCKEVKIPLVVHFHGYDSTVSYVFEENNRYKNLFSYASKIIAVSQKMKRDLIALGCSADKIECHPCGPNSDFFKVTPLLSGSHFIGIGRFTNKKAPYYTILAFSKVLKLYPDARLTIGGYGELFDVCKNLIKYLEIEHAVNLPGILNRNQFALLLSQSVAFVQHSLVTESGDAEGAPVAILEASAAGVPVISTKHAGIPEIVIDGVTGILVEEHDVEGMSRAMEKILADGILRNNMSKEGRKFVLENFSMDSYISMVASLLIESHKNYISSSRRLYNS